MTKGLFRILLFCGAATTVYAQADLYQHVWWDATGTRQNQQWGFFGLDSVGALNPSTGTASSIGSDHISGLVLNRFQLDTVPVFHFPGRDVITAHFNDDPYPDVLCIDIFTPKAARVLLGTDRLDSFVTAATIHLDLNNVAGSEITHTVCVMDLDSDNRSDVVFSNLNYEADSAGMVGRLYMYKGGEPFDTTPAMTLTGKAHLTDYVGGALMKGKFFPDRGPCMAEARMYGPRANVGHYDTMRVFLYPARKDFQLVPTDTLTFVFDSTGTQEVNNIYDIVAVDITGDGLSEILVHGPAVVYAFRTDQHVGGKPFMTFHRPFVTNSAEFGATIVDVGDVTGMGYHTLLIADPFAQNGGADNGAVFLYNIGKALKDSCVAWAAGHGFEAQMGTHVIPVRDLDHDGAGDFMVARDVIPTGSPIHMGGVTLFLGQSSYGNPLSVRELRLPPQDLTLSQNTPNPVSMSTDITFGIRAAPTTGVEVTLTLYDCLGRRVTTLFRGAADGYGYTVRYSTAALPAGTYIYRLQCGVETRSRQMIVLR